MGVAGECVFAYHRNAFGNSVVRRSARGQVIEQLLFVSRVYSAALVVGGKVYAAYDGYALQIVAAEHARAERFKVCRKFDVRNFRAVIEYMVAESGNAVGQLNRSKLRARAKCFVTDLFKFKAFKFNVCKFTAAINCIVSYPYGICVYLKFARLACGAVNQLFIAFGIDSAIV